ncbi:FAD-binding protein [Niallia sp. Krafla_26]|uniref:FAD-binding protein n=1 Tax=Niallia sp. Krafla_26 TaxID=3064703 RepID=UPI003D171714
MITFNRKIKTDILVAGSGLSGIKVTKELADQGHQVLMVTKSKVASGSSFYPLKASLGTQVTKDEEDQQTFLSDIEALSRGMHRKDLAEVYVKEIPERVKEYQDIGVNAKKLEGERKACFAENSRDIYLLSDWDRIRKNVNEIFAQYEGLNIMEKSVVVTLIQKEKRIVGAVLLDEHNEFILVKCKAAILATGGFGSIYKHNLNPNDVDGSGHILALEAGASLVNMEFIQFIPGITTPKYKTLFGEHTLMYCEDMIDENGNSILDPYLPEYLSKRECLESRSTHGPFTHSMESKYFDIAMMKQIIETHSEKGFELIYDPKLYENKEEFYTVYLDWLKEKNIDLIENEVRIAPFAHASNGGVYIDTYGRTGINGLYAIGELSCNIEGANRLGGNSTGACMVFGKRAAIDCGEYVRTVVPYEISESEGKTQVAKMFEGFGKTEIYTDGATHEIKGQAHEIIENINEVMWYHGNVIRSEKGLLNALERIEVLSKKLEIGLLFKERSTRKLAVKLRNYFILSKILLRTMLERKESRGAHYREDYPSENPEFNKRLFISRDNSGEIQYGFLNK